MNRVYYQGVYEGLRLAQRILNSESVKNGRVNVEQVIEFHINNLIEKENRKQEIENHLRIEKVS